MVLWDLEKDVRVVMTIKRTTTAAEERFFLGEGTIGFLLFGARLFVAKE